MQFSPSALSNTTKVRGRPTATAQRRTLQRVVVQRLLVLLPSLLASNSWAVLGQAPSPATTPPPAAAAAFPASHPVHANASAGHANSPLYSVHSSQLESGTWIHEYTSNAGVVFALAWYGPAMPDLQTLLGSYTDTFSQAARASRPQRSLGAPLAIQGHDLVVHSSGRSGHFAGYACAPLLVPVGLNINDVLP